MSHFTKRPEDIEILVEAGKRHAAILTILAEMVLPGVSTHTLNETAEKLIVDGGDEPAFLGYTPEGASRPYPAGLCVSVNDAIVHGIPNEHPLILKEGDIVGLDLGVRHNGMITDSALTVPVGKIDAVAKKLIQATREALRAGNTTGDIGEAIERVATSYGFPVVSELGGHGVGYRVHEEPFVPNFGTKGEGEPLVPGMVLALEPILSEGSSRIKLDRDGYTYRTRDGSRSAHFEHTIVITDGPARVLTRREGE